MTVPSSHTDSTSWSGAINPRAIAELIAGEAIDWSALPDPDAATAAILGVARSDLYDPTSRAPHFALVDIARLARTRNVAFDPPRQLDSADQQRSFNVSLGIDAPSISDTAGAVLARMAIARL